MNNPEIVVDLDVLTAYSEAVSTIKLKVGKEEENNNIAVAEVIQKMQQLDYAQYEICDMLIKDMFKEHTVFKDPRCKNIFFSIYGDIVYDNIVANKSKYENICIDCGADINRVNGKCRCAECQAKYRRKYKTAKQNAYRENVWTTENV